MGKHTIHEAAIREWHLRNDGPANGVAGADCNVLPAWVHTPGDPEITIAVIDNGFDLKHPGLSVPGKFRDPYDAASSEIAPTTETMAGAHGTPCAEVAVGTGHRGTLRGTAPGCSWMPIRIDGRVGDPQEVRAFQHAFDCSADIISCSWGALDGLRNEPWPISPELRDMIRRCVKEGRNGRGIPVLFAAGNGGEPVELDGYADNPDIICVAATTNQDEKAAYSDYGRNVWVCAPSSGGTLDIQTSARSRQDAGTMVTGKFGSTSASVAMVAGITGLMLSVNPALDAGAVRDILRQTAAKIHRDRTPLEFKDRWGGDYNDGYDPQGHSVVYGWGRVDAAAAVEETLRSRA